MRFLSVFLCLFLLSPLAVLAAGAEDTDPYLKEYQGDYAAAYAFQKALAANERQKVAQFVGYPYRMPKPMKPIRNADEFVKHWDYFFTKKDVAQLTDPKDVGHIGWRGVMISPGTVWFRSGKITVIQTYTPAFLQALKQAESADQAKFHASVGVYDRIARACETPTKRVRIHATDNPQGKERYRLILWDVKSKRAAAPLTVIDGAEYENMGTAHNEVWKFTSSDFTYELENHNVCGEDCNEYLTVRQGDKEIEKEVCRD